MYLTKQRLLILDADGTVIDAFTAINEAFAQHKMSLGDLDRFQKRHNIFKYLGGAKEFPGNLAKQIGNRRRKAVLATLTDIYRQQAELYPGMPALIRSLIAAKDVKVGIVTRNVTVEPSVTLAQLFARHDIDVKQLDFVEYLPLSEGKGLCFKAIRARLDINPARAFACGDEHRDYEAATAAGIHPLIVSYGFESFERLSTKYAIPVEVIARTPEELTARVRHTLDLPA
jgi:phosphoglycolate phosphatase